VIDDAKDALGDDPMVDPFLQCNIADLYAA
jgi:hypothetical protein